MRFTFTEVQIKLARKGGKLVTSKSDVVVIGGGIIGLTLSLSLLEKGLSVICLEKETIGYGCSNASLGIIYPISPLTADNYLVDLSLKAFNLYREFLYKLTEETGELIGTTDSGLIQIGFNEFDMHELEKTYEEYRKISVNVQKMSQDDILKLEPMLIPSVTGGTFFPEAFHVYCQDLIRVLAKAVVQKGGKILESSEANSLIIQNDRCMGVTTPQEDYHAQTVAICGGAWSSLLEGVPKYFSDVLIPIKGQAIIANASSTLTNHIIYTPALDIVPRKDGYLLVGSTVEQSGYNLRSTLEGIHFLLDNLFYTLPATTQLQFKDVWVGLRPKTIDELPIIGQIPGIEGLHISTGHYKNGIFLSPLTSAMHADYILGKREESMQTLNPARLMSS